MSLRYFYEFRGTDNVLNKVEIVAKKTVSAKEITAFGENPFSISYPKTLKLDPIQGSGFSMNLVSEEVFQFMDLHTDDMQEYMIRFYRAGQLYWIGYLDPELYSENLSSSPPYDVEFSGADFNIMERLTFLDDKEKEYTDINTLLVQLKRCLNKLALPFQKLYIGCSTIPGDVVLSPSETALHKLYIQSANFYDEDKEPMKCREVVESILQPFGLMMVQRDASIFIYDYNTIETGGVMKSYSFDTLSYAGDTPVSILLGDISEIGTVSTDASLGFEALVNNTDITSSLYGDKKIFNESISEKTLSEKKTNIVTGNKYKIEYFAKDENIESLNAGEFIVYTNTENDSTIIGANLPYGQVSQFEKRYVIKGNQYIIGNEGYSINIKMNAYANTRDNPFSSDLPPGDTSRAKILFLKGTLYTVSSEGIPLNVYQMGQWRPTNGVVPNGGLEFFFASDKDTWNANPFNSWITNSNIYPRFIVGENYPPMLEEKNFLKGQNIDLKSNANGYLVFDILQESYIAHPTGSAYPYVGVKNVIINDISLTILDKNGDEISTDDYEFKSYINKKVASDYNNVVLNCISGNEDKLPVGKANILKKMTDHYELQLSYTRGGQTNILERLLMCTIHSNYSAKNREIKIDLSMTENPMMRKVSYNSVLGDRKLLTTGCMLDFRNATTTIEATDFSKDFMSLSSIPYQ